MLAILLQLLVSLTLSGVSLTSDQQARVNSAVVSGDHNQVQIVVDEIQQYTNNGSR